MVCGYVDSPNVAPCLVDVMLTYNGPATVVEMDAICIGCISTGERIAGLWLRPGPTAKLKVFYRRVRNMMQE